MKRLFLLVLLLGVLGLGVVGVGVVVRWLGLWSVPVALGVVVGGYFVGKWLVRKALQRAAYGLFGMKGGALRGARLEVFSVAPACAPAGRRGDSEDEEEGSGAGRPTGEADFWLVEFALQPAAEVNSPMRAWEPGELRLARPGSDAMADDAELGHPLGIEVLQADGSWGADEGMKYGGAQRLRVLFEVARGTQAAELAYYFERLGTIRFGAA